MERPDDLIRRALGAWRAEPEPASSILDRAIASGARRRRVVGALVLSASAVVVIGGVLTLTRGADELVGVAPSPPTTSPVASAAPTPAQMPTTMPTIVTAPSTSPMTSTASVPPTLVTSPPFVQQPPDPTLGTCDPVPELTVERLELSVDGSVPPQSDGVLTQRYVEFRPTGIELWGTDGHAATLRDTVPDDPDQWYCPTGLVPMGYDGRFLWAAVGGSGGCEACAGAPLRSRLFRADVTTRSVTEAWTSAGDDQVLGMLPAADGSVSVLAGPRFGATGDLGFRPSSADAGIGERTWSLDGPLVDARLVVAGTDPLTRPYVVYVTGGPYGSPTTLHVVVLGERDQVFELDLTGVVLQPGILGVSPDGVGVLLQERWEGLGAVLLVRLDSGDSISVGSGGCWTSSGLLARSTWTYDSERIYGDPGTIELVNPADLAVVADLGLDTYGGALACLGGERIALSAFDGVPWDPTTGAAASVVPGSERLVIIEQGGVTELTADPDLRAVGRNGND